MDNSTQTLNLVLVSAPSMDSAKEIAARIISARLAACVNIIPGLLSIYEWEGKVQEEAEVLMLIKSRPSIFPELEKAILSCHPYDTPEIISVESAAVTEKYLKWAISVTC